jgi:hypothetical protein
VTLAIGLIVEERQTPEIKVKIDFIMICIFNNKKGPNNL